MPISTNVEINFKLGVTYSSSFSNSYIENWIQIKIKLQW